nr:MAG TPA: hypothetical protein [Caudoviricetes sp.]DAT43929.1 MAG TPA: hypothetical protein [Caudoviricetes sp.]
MGIKSIRGKIESPAVINVEPTSDGATIALQ